MPQLDFTIAFPQIFSLFFTFFLLYGTITHFFLPIFVKSLKTRKNIIIENNNLMDNLRTKLLLKQNFVTSLLIKNILNIKQVLVNNILPVYIINSSFDFSSVNHKLAKALYHNTVYYDINILDSIILKPKFLNLKNFKDNQCTY
uniref:ATP synthase F0 subunit 8 n=1 Tax=Calliarthron tuberculosum TaxID=48942 RepID=A0A0F7EWU1_CALTB|nr:ATP synthase F0 subunit 8 [Calliarthron tuberculosum]AKG26271.1 ATP synthase F0 subunit 8 [Calliarthron tuberculosum]